MLHSFVKKDKKSPLILFELKDLFFDSWWCHQESNRGHKDFQSDALPTELWHHQIFCKSRVQRYVFILFLQVFFGNKNASFKKMVYLCQRFLRAIAECSAVGSALRSGRRGRAFESPHSDMQKGYLLKKQIPFFIFHSRE